MARYYSDGKLDTGLDSGGKLVLAGNVNGNFNLARINAGPLDQRLYAAQDANHNVTALIDTSTAVVERYEYDPYGKATVLDANWAADSDGISDVGWVYLHQGLRYDSAAGLYDNRIRPTSPTLGRSLSQDPLGYVAGMSRYQMYGSNPESYTDSLGLKAAATTMPAAIRAEVADLQSILEEYHGVIGQIQRLPAMIQRDCGCSNAANSPLIQRAKDTLLNANTAITAGLSAVSAQKFLGAKNLLVPWVRGKVAWVGNTLTIVGIGFELWNFGDAVYHGDASSAISSGGIITGSIWGLWNPYVAVAVAAGSLGKVGIEHYYNGVGEKVAREANAKACDTWKKLLESAITRENDLRPQALNALQRLLEIGSQYAN